MNDQKGQNGSPATGIIKTTGKGMGFVNVEGYEEDVVIQPEFLNTALNGDEVEIIVTGKYLEVKRMRPQQQTSSQEATFPRMAGQVVKILKRAKTNFVGLLIYKEGKYQLIPDDRKMYVPLIIPNYKPAADIQATIEKNAAEKKATLKALVHLTGWEKNEEYPRGEVLQIIGTKGDHETEMQSIILDRGIDTTFPEDVTKEAEGLEKTEKPLKESEIAKRRDMRGTFTSTIDPADAKDFDDAISYKSLDGGRFEIGIHIADVSYYVREGTALDAEARERATSVYLVDRTIPMLPEVLSNDLCSLNPHEDKFTFSSVFIMNAEGEVLERWFGRTVINSDMRFTYETAQESIDSGTGTYSNELRTLNQIAKKLERKNYVNGAIDFATEEVKFKLDDKGKPISVYKREHLDTHKLVEEYMLLANREVAEFISKSLNGNGSSLYRIHDVPDAERLANLALFLEALGFHLPVKQNNVSSRDINALLTSIKGKPEESLIKTATIRSMSKAIYSQRNIGHFGLGFHYYTHFTSPIRRYPDLVIHRILQDVLSKDQEGLQHESAQLEKIALNSTEREISAAEAERASIKYKQVEYMSEHIGEEFDGMISGVTEWGIYIEEENTKCEGMVMLRELGNDFYIFNRKTYSVKGEKTKKEYRLGDKVRFKVMKADLDSKTLDYKLV
jgi:ribonuclease R